MSLFIDKNNNLNTLSLNIQFINMIVVEYRINTLEELHVYNEIKKSVII